VYAKSRSSSMEEIKKLKRKFFLSIKKSSMGKKTQKLIFPILKRLMITPDISTA
jgi:hypothetical protein